MDQSETWSNLAERHGGRILYLIVDGLGGLSHPTRRLSELQAANTPHLDELARQSSCGMLELAGPGITPGSGPGHLALFGYDPFTYQVGRGVLAALGMGFDLRPGDVSARMNFATVDDKDSKIVDRRAGRISTDLNRQLCHKLRDAIELKFDGQFFLEPVKDHRAVLILRGPGLGGNLSDSDPQKNGVPPLDPESKNSEANKSLRIVHSFISQATEALSGEKPANMILLRGFSRYRPLPSMSERFGLKGICFAEYPMYRGLSRLLGLTISEIPATLGNRFEPLRQIDRDRFDFYYLHVKQADSAGEDGDFDRKVSVLEEIDANLPGLLNFAPDVLVITGDHSTPSIMASHSWHPVPVMIYSKFARKDPVTRFDEYDCRWGTLGFRPAIHLLGLALAHAGRLRKYDA
jgi:2,3-bisphosphoglycerate-independent phosphoglycerate mutase